MKWKLLYFWTLLFVTVLLFGCATQLVNSTGSLEEPIAFIVVETSNRHKITKTPHIKIINVITVNGDNKYEYTFKAGKPYEVIRGVTENINKYAFIFRFPPGKYKIVDMSGIGPQTSLGLAASGILSPFSPGMFRMPIFTDFHLQPNQIIYLGHIKAIVRKKYDKTEFSAGDFNPAFVGQAISGYNQSTFDINIFDNYNDDIDLFRQKYPEISNHPVVKMILPPWERPSKRKLKDFYYSVPIDSDASQPIGVGKRAY
jgi:hypothetical protein